MHWLIHLFFLFFRLGTTFLALFMTFLAFAVTNCVYFKLWKLYDTLAIFTSFMLACLLPFMRHDNSLFATGWLFHSMCRRGKSIPGALNEMFHNEYLRADTPEAKKRRHLNSALNLALFLVRLRISIAMLIGRLHGATTNASSFVITFYRLLYIDVGLLWLQVCWAAWRQLQVFCQLGCVKFHMWILIVIVIAGAAMELPMAFASKAYDNSWCCWRDENLAVAAVIDCYRTAV